MVKQEGSRFMANAPAGRSKPAGVDRAREVGVMSSVLKTFDVLDVYQRLWRPLSVTELCRETGFPKSSLHRILSTLVRAGVLQQNDEGLYCLTLMLWKIGVWALGEVDMLQIAREHLETLSQATDETVHLAVLEPDGGVVYLSKVESTRSIRVQTQVGRVTPAWCTATGRALLAHNPQLRDRVLVGPLTKFTSNTEIDPTRLLHIIQQVAKDGYAVTKSENHPEMGGIAAPVRDHSGAVVASCGVAIPAFRMDQSLIERCTSLVLKAASDISANLNYPYSNTDVARDVHAFSTR
jgi:DNA-binding IclR family transcriptional regulator